MASYETLLKLRENPNWIAPRSDTRVFLGEPCGPEGAKTTVEPGNSFSPGMATFGVTWWIRFPQNNTFFSPDLAAIEELKWSFEDGFLPVIHCDVAIDPISVRHSLFQDGTSENQSEAVCGKMELVNKDGAEREISLFLVLRSLGPAGGPITDLRVGKDKKSLWLLNRNLPLLGVDQVPNKIGCGVGDPSEGARSGAIDGAPSAVDKDGWVYGMMQFDLTLKPSESWSVRFDAPIQSHGVVPEELPGLQVLRPESFESRAEAHINNWKERLQSISVDVPEVNFRNAFYANLQHMLVATVGDQIRLAPLSYPLPWMRDSVAIMRCFDLAGFHDLALKTSEICVRQDFFGGFGAEADSPGQGIWALAEHYRITKDRDWLRRVYPSIERKCDWILQMRRAEKPIQVVLDTPLLPFMQAYRNVGTICLAAKDGLIMGVMDMHVREGQTNQWCICGLDEAAYAAAELGYEEDARFYQSEAADLKAALSRYMEKTPNFFEWERNVNSLVWPTRTWEYEPEKVIEGFKAWWKEQRGSESSYIPEKYWVHFELGQIHNALMLGLREQAWQGLKYRLENQDIPGLYGWREYGGGMEVAGNAVNGVSLINQLRGCQKFDKITPHGWCAAEMWLLQRGMLIEEWQGGLDLFYGVPSEWIKANAKFAFANLPTWYGKVSAEATYDKDGQVKTIFASGITPGTTVRILLPDFNRELVADGEGKIVFSQNG